MKTPKKPTVNYLTGKKLLDQIIILSDEYCLSGRDLSKIMDIHESWFAIFRKRGTMSKKMSIKLMTLFEVLQDKRNLNLVCVKTTYETSRSYNARKFFCTVKLHCLFYEKFLGKTWTNCALPV